jgi:hypothetical protein
MLGWVSAQWPWWVTGPGSIGARDVRLRGRLTGQLRHDDHLLRVAVVVTLALHALTGGAL